MKTEITQNEINENIVYWKKMCFLANGCKTCVANPDPCKTLEEILRGN